MNSASTSKPVLELFGIVLIEDPWEVLLLLAVAGFFIWRALVKKKSNPSSNVSSLSTEEIARKIAIQAAGASAPMTLFLALFIVTIVPLYFFSDSQFFWIPAIPFLIAIYYGIPAAKRGRALQKQVNYFAAVELFRANGKQMVKEALEDSWVKKQLAPFPNSVVKIMIQVITLGMK